MATRTIKKTEKTDSNNVLQTINITGYPENLDDMLAASSDEAYQAKLYLLLRAAVDQNTKAVLPDGTHSIDFVEAVMRGGRRTQSGLNEAIAALIVKASGLPSVVAIAIPQLIALQTKANKEFKGHVDEYYAEFYAIQATVDNAE